MLHVEKQNLLAETNRDIAILREMELRYYMEHIGGMQTMATLLAGFSFTALISSNTLSLDFGTFLFRDDEPTKGSLIMQNMTHGEYTETSGTLIDKMQLPGWDDPFKYLSFFMHVLELTSIVMSLGEMLHVITSTLIARLLGARLALRGPDGSIIRATRHLAHALNANTRSFFNGLQYFMFSVIFHLFRGQHPVVAILLTYLLYTYWRRQGVIANQLSNNFHLTKGVTTAFVDDNDDAAEADKPGSPATPAGAAQATWRSIQTSLNKRGSGFRNWRMKFNKFIRPVSTELQFLYDEVAEDFEGESAHANAQHRGPTAATQHLIRRNESKKLDMDAFVSPLDEYQENRLARRKQAREAAAAAASASRVPTVLEEPEEEPDIGIQVKNAWNSARNWLHTQMDVVNVDIPAHDGLRVAAHSPTTPGAYQPGARFGEQVDMARAMMERGEVVDRRDVV